MVGTRKLSIRVLINAISKMPLLHKIISKCIVHNTPKNQHQVWRGWENITEKNPISTLARNTKMPKKAYEALNSCSNFGHVHFWEVLLQK